MGTSTPEATLRKTPKHALKNSEITDIAETVEQDEYFHCITQYILARKLHCCKPSYSDY
jgi:hypothetical protein